PTESVEFFRSGYLYKTPKCYVTVYRCCVKKKRKPSPVLKKGALSIQYCTAIDMNRLPGYIACIITGQIHICRSEFFRFPGSFHWGVDRKSTRLNSSHVSISYAVFC